MMDTSVAFDHALRLVRASIGGRFERDGIVALADQMQLEGAWEYPLLLDMRALTSLPSLEDLALITTKVAASSTDQRRGPLALVARDGQQYAKACTYFALGMRHQRKIEIFREPDDAEHWIAGLAP